MAHTSPQGAPASGCGNSKGVQVTQRTQLVRGSGNIGAAEPDLLAAEVHPEVPAAVLAETLVTQENLVEEVVRT